MPARRFFQIHLSTAVVVMLVAGALVWANVREKAELDFWPRWNNQVNQAVNYSYGWPFMCRAQLYFESYRGSRGPLIQNYWLKKELGYNVAIALAILLSVCVTSEWLIRRRAVPPQ